MAWAPPGGVEREVPVCFRCSERLAEGAVPDIRRVRFGNRTVPWFQGGPAYAAYVEGYYGRYARDGHFPEFVIAAILLGVAAGPWADDGPGSTSYDWGGGHGGQGDLGIDIGDVGSGGDGGGGGGD